jgi:ribonuclease P protein subunit POP4
VFFVVVQSTNPSFIGATGIVIQETLSMFKIITKENKLKREFNVYLLIQNPNHLCIIEIPKNSSNFNVHIQQTHTNYTLYGPQLVARPAERAAKKFKPKPSIDL